MKQDSFVVRRRNPELVAPARATPRDTKPLSDLDNDWFLRYIQPCLEFFRAVDDDDGHHHHRRRPADAIKAALAEALVYYYPMAGRLRELPNGKLSVECTGEGVVFVEAEADVRIEDMGEPPMPLFRGSDEFLCDVGDAKVIVGRPLFFMQITQLKCGGFVLGTYHCHCIADGSGIFQLLKAIFDIARGEAKPTVLPVWDRELFVATSLSPHIIEEHQTLFDELESATCDDIMVTMPTENMVSEYFTISEKQMSYLWRNVPLNLTKTITSFELLTAVLWRCRTVALGYKPWQNVLLKIIINARGRWRKLPLGYYGNGLMYPIVETTVKELCTNPLEHTIELVRKAKHKIRTEENMQLMVDVMPLWYEKPYIKVQRIFETCDIKWIGQDTLDIGCAKRIGGGIPTVNLPDTTSYQFRFKNEKNEKSIVISMLLPRPAMDIFKEEMAAWLNEYSIRPKM
ncbi:hypothetical protein OsJ_36019 [Oryza sativa Japonica Group]|jgi:hypothetical protein|nr:spermidine hydroxycinnamoyltransferase 2-like [Oryza sativa Japonica Group]EAZ20412.1 hypothetical protein OsJ_36019 [Oryza sativa Japonica Group]KAF2907739.1 hypothetical protein DAI22_12g121700 [Oryza sativa Japonica Group]